MFAVSKFIHSKAEKQLKKGLFSFQLLQTTDFYIPQASTGTTQHSRALVSWGPWLVLQCSTYKPGAFLRVLLHLLPFWIIYVSMKI